MCFSKVASLLSQNLRHWRWSFFKTGIGRGNGWIFLKILNEVWGVIRIRDIRITIFLIIYIFIIDIFVIVYWVEYFLQTLWLIFFKIIFDFIIFVFIFDVLLIFIFGFILVFIFGVIFGVISGVIFGDIFALILVTDYSKYSLFVLSTKFPIKEKIFSAINFNAFTLMSNRRLIKTLTMTR